MSDEREPLSGEMVDLEPIAPSDAGAVAQDFQAPSFFRHFFEAGPIGADRMQNLLGPRGNYLWRMCSKDGDPIGYAGIVLREGPETLFYECLDGKVDHDAGCEALSLIAPVYFQDLDPKSQLVIFFADNESLEEVEPLLLEYGFDDYREGYAYHDAEAQTPFAIFRSTFDAYYGEGADEDLDDV